MALQAPPSFWGLLTIGTSNNKVYFRETDGVTPSDRTATIPDGSYYPDASSGPESLATVIGDQMTAASTYGATYVVAVSSTDGTVTITASGGTLTGFLLMLTATETSKLLTGGDASSGEQGLDHYGCLVDSSYPGGYALSVSSDTQVCNAWHPQGPLANQTSIKGVDYRYTTSFSQISTLGHRTVTRDFSPRVASTDIDYSEVATLQFQYLSNTDRQNFQKYFYSTYAKTGAKIRWFPDRGSLSSYTEVHLTEESIRDFSPSRLEGYQHYSLPLHLKRWKA